MPRHTIRRENSRKMFAVENLQDISHVRERPKFEPNLRILPLGDANARRTAWKHSDYFYPEMIPEPDYSDSEEEEEEEENEAEEREGSEERLRDVEEQQEDEEEVRKRKLQGPPTQKAAKGKEIGIWKQESEELIKPKKPSNPYLDSTERQKLNKELKFSQKYGKSTANKRSELEIAMEKYKEGRLKKDLAAARRTSLEKILEIQAKKIEMQEKEGLRAPAWLDRLQRQQNQTFSDSHADEFYRVHARVVSNASFAGSSETLPVRKSSSKNLSRTSRDSTRASSIGSDNNSDSDSESQ